MSKGLRIKPVENGFIVIEDEGPTMFGKEWVFNNSAALARFIDMYYNPILELESNESKNISNKGK